MPTITINIPEKFSKTPGPRYERDGPNSGEEFRQKHLEPLFTGPNQNDPILIILDGAIGYPTSFLEEAFGGLVRSLGKDKKDKIVKRITFESVRDPSLVDEIMRYIDDAAAQ